MMHESMSGRCSARCTEELISHVVDELSLILLYRRQTLDLFVRCDRAVHDARTNKTVIRVIKLDHW
jgi:hypothetical protein